MITNAMTTQKRATSWTAYLVLAREPLPGGLRLMQPDRPLNRQSDQQAVSVSKATPLTVVVPV
jgi:hypothetical protein